MPSIKKRKSKLVRSLRRKTLDGANDIRLDVILPLDANEFKFYERGSLQKLHLLSGKKYVLNIVLGFNPKETFDCDIKLFDGNGNHITNKLISDNIPPTLESSAEIENRIPFQVVLDENEEFIDCRFRVKVTNKEHVHVVYSDYFCVSKYKLITPETEDQDLITYYKEPHNQPKPIPVNCVMIYYENNIPRRADKTVILSSTLCKVIDVRSNELIIDESIQKELHSGKRKVIPFLQLEYGFLRDSFRINVLTKDKGGKNYFRVLFFEKEKDLSDIRKCYGIIPYVTPAIEVLSKMPAPAEKKRKTEEGLEEHPYPTKKQKSNQHPEMPQHENLSLSEVKQKSNQYPGMPMAPPPAVVRPQHENLSLLSEVALLSEGGGVPNGKGKTTFLNGDVYEGEFRNYLPHGKGKKTFLNGSFYEGEFHNGAPNGKGTMKFFNGDVYEGEFHTGAPNGKGTMKFLDGKVYEGDFLNGVPHGKGRTFKKDSFYEGEFLNGVPHGKGMGRIFLIGGGVYEGKLLNGKPHGRGKASLDSKVYEGDFLNGAPHGRGKETFKNGNSVEGVFENSLLTGECKVKSENSVFQGYIRLGAGGQLKEKYGIDYKNGKIIKVTFENIEGDVDFNKYKKYIDGSFEYHDYITLETNPTENNIDSLLDVIENGSDDTVIFFQENGKKIFASKAILINNSDMLKKYFESEVGSATRTTDITHFFTNFKKDNPGYDVTYDIIKKLLDFINKGRFKNPEDNKNETLQRLINYLLIITEPPIEKLIEIEKKDGNRGKRQKKLSSIKKRSKNKRQHSKEKSKKRSRRKSVKKTSI